MINTTVKTLDGEVMDSNLLIRIDNDLKEKFKEAVEHQNPHLPKNGAVSAVIREFIVKYVDDYKSKESEKE